MWERGRDLVREGPLSPSNTHWYWNDNQTIRSSHNGCQGSDWPAEQRKFWVVPVKQARLEDPDTDVGKTCDVANEHDYLQCLCKGISHTSYRGRPIAVILDTAITWSERVSCFLCVTLKFMFCILIDFVSGSPRLLVISLQVHYCRNAFDNFSGRNLHRSFDWSW